MSLKWGTRDTFAICVAAAFMFTGCAVTSTSVHVTFEDGAKVEARSITRALFQSEIRANDKYISGEVRTASGDYVRIDGTGTVEGVISKEELSSVIDLALKALVMVP